MLKLISSSFVVASVVLGMSMSANATTVVVGGSAPATYTPITFGSSLAATSGSAVWSGTATTGTANTSLINTYLDPLSGSAYFAYAEVGGLITANFSAGITGLDLLWGSPDSYNTITFYTGLNGTGTAESYSPGIAPLISFSPVQLSEAFVLFTSTPGVTWNSVTFGSGFNSFEFADVSTFPAATGSSIPEPSAIVLLGVGLVAISSGLIRRHKARV